MAKAAPTPTTSPAIVRWSGVIRVRRSAAPIGLTARSIGVRNLPSNTPARLPRVARAASGPCRLWTHECLDARRPRHDVPLTRPAPPRSDRRRRPGCTSPASTAELQRQVEGAARRPSARPPIPTPSPRRSGRGRRRRGTTPRSTRCAVTPSTPAPCCAGCPRPPPPRPVPTMNAEPTRIPWWREAVIYQVYVRSFADADGDGLGDLAGIRSRLPYLRRLGVDAIWLNPCYPSPQADAGYDVADYRDIDPRFGTLADIDGLLADAHALGLRVIIDIVPNHTSDEHAWFQAGAGGRARAAGSGPGTCSATDAARAAAQPPNDWQSTFGGPAWTRVTEADGPPGQWYLHLFDIKQPDLDWMNDEVRDGVRVDPALLVRPWRRRLPHRRRPRAGQGSRDARPRRALRRRRAGRGRASALGPRRGPRRLPAGGGEVSDEYDGERAFVAEVWVQTRRAPGPLPAPGRAAHGVQLPLPAGAVGRRRAARGDRHEHRRPRRGRRPADVGAVEPRRRPPRHPLRRGRARHGGGPARRRC